jgi:hypothetical protein
MNLDLIYLDNNLIQFKTKMLGIGDWGLGIGDWAHLLFKLF